MNEVINFLNTIFWDYILIYGLLAVGLFFTIRLKFIQFIHFKEMFKSVFDKDETDESGISPLQALTISLASRVGTGNLAGVAIALYVGGAGAIFWMWIVALVGMATAYAESTLAQLYKVKDVNDQYRGGPAFYIAKGLKSPILAAIFSISLIIAFGLIFNAVQANSIAEAVSTAFDIDKMYVGYTIALVAALVIFGGIKGIAKIAEIVVPFMAIVYLLLAVFTMIVNYDAVPGIIALIVKSAFGLQEAVGGVTGGVVAALLNGVKRGLFSNEAGMGSAPNIAAVATPTPHHPSSQGFVQALGVFIDTLLICTATAVMILLAGVLEPGSGIKGIELTQAALTVHIGEAGKYFVAIAILFFAFTSIIGNYTYAENALTYLGAGKKTWIFLLRIAAISMVIWGSYEKVQTVFNAADAAMGLMATINLIAIVLLSGTVIKLTKDYLEQRQRGEDPTFEAKNYPELKDKIDTTIWIK
ncbi:sodium:alanine symporter family protein [Malaciobacter molluscorum LMG 25693]|uniref:Sodium:alanine symporter family protein n=1 Tax=Malaciobacter molluscorum LMG 25693 TaxID=870501 RepID=A0A2G1DF49_9BACT|nr:sodium:alanine symporter family protein [Malaciobacter molluscorum]AXX91249.1 sodium:alanine symporter family protein [Malaciobacter molluscorum LMG 25693]PHO17074.1 sodium:alanine symporter family protein [Malaciobacter molluscorum LMG 25693]RXJ92189.1 sodium:alanine symporter family protein [Malaciobacter molluscorum]